MDDPAELERRIARLETELAEVKAALGRHTGSPVPEAGPPVPQAVRPGPEAPQPPVQPPPPPVHASPPPAIPDFLPPPPTGSSKRGRRGLLGSLLWSHRELPAGTPAPTAAQSAWQRRPAPPPSPPGPAAPKLRPLEGPYRSGELEANLLGSWFARIGILAIFFGAAFAFKYAVDRDLVSPAGRVLIGVLVGLGFAGWGEWARRREWPLFAQAVAGGGTAILYLAVWAGYQLYDLTSPAMTLALLAAVVAFGGALSVRHDAMPLAFLAALGGFANPLLVSSGRGALGALYLYLLLLDTGILALAFYKGWRPLAVLAMAASWFLVLTALAGSVVGGEAGPSERLLAVGFGTAFFLAFSGFLLHRYLRSRETATQGELRLTTLNSLAFGAFGLVAATQSWDPLFAFVLGLAHLGFGASWRRYRPGDSSAVLTFLLLGVGAVTLAAGLQFEDSALAAVWAVEAVVILAASVEGGLSRLRLASFGVFALSIGLSLLGSDLGAGYEPPRAILSMESLPFITQVAALWGSASLLRRQGDSAPERRAAESAEVLAIVLKGLWLTFELAAQYQRAGWPDRTLPYAIAAFWAVYAAAAGAFGLSRRASWAKPLAASIFALAVATSLLGSGLGALYDPERVVVSVESSPFVLQVALLAAAALLLRRETNSEPRPRLADGAAAAGNLLALAWMTFEVWAFYNNNAARGDFAAFTFTLSTVWTLYAAGLLAFGIGKRARWARLMAAALFGIVIFKLVAADVWLLKTPLRIAALVGLGFVLLLCSVGYHRFRALVLRPDDTSTA